MKPAMCACDTGRCYVPVARWMVPKVELKGEARELEGTWKKVHVNESSMHMYDVKGEGR